MLSAPITIPAITLADLTTGFGAGTDTPSLSRSCRPAVAASRITGTRPAADTRSGSIHRGVAGRRRPGRVLQPVQCRRDSSMSRFLDRGCRSRTRQSSSNASGWLLVSPDLDLSADPGLTQRSAMWWSSGALDHATANGFAVSVSSMTAKRSPPGSSRVDWTPFGVDAARGPWRMQVRAEAPAPASHGEVSGRSCA